MNKELQEKIINFCLDNESKTDEEVKKDLAKMLGIKSGSETYTFNHQENNIFRACNISFKTMNHAVDVINDCLKRNDKFSEAIEEACTVPELTKPLLLLMVNESNKRYATLLAKERMRRGGMDFFGRGED